MKCDGREGSTALSLSFVLSANEFFDAYHRILPHFINCWLVSLTPFQKFDMLHFLFTLCWLWPSLLFLCIYFPLILHLQKGNFLQRKMQFIWLYFLFLCPIKRLSFGAIYFKSINRKRSHELVRDDYCASEVIIIKLNYFEWKGIDCCHLVALLHESLMK